ncbi:MAG: VOC family protein [Pseudomonadota bacterium]
MTTKIGTMGWLDITDEQAPALRDFYQSVVGFQIEAMSMDDYDDYILKTADGETMVAGIVNKRGPNAEVPKGWIPYFVVADLDQSLEQVTGLGGQIIGNERSYGDGRFCFIRDPSDAICALFQEGESS